MLLGTETRAEQLGVNSGVQSDEKGNSKRWQNELQTSVVWTRACGGQKLILLNCRGRGWVWSAWDLNIFPRITNAAYRDHLFLSAQRCTKGTAKQARQVMLCALASIKTDCIFLCGMCGMGIKVRNAIPKVAFQMTLYDCQRKRKSIAPYLRKYSSYKPTVAYI